VHANTAGARFHVSMPVFMQLKSNYNVPALIFLISTVEEWSQPTKHAKQNFGINIFDYEGHNP